MVRHVAIEPNIAQHTTRDRTDVSSFAPFANATGNILVFRTALSSRGTMAWKHFSHALMTCSQTQRNVQTCTRTAARDGLFRHV